MDKPSLEQSRNSIDWFVPTKDSPGEIRKAYRKNRNLPILQYMWMGHPLQPLACSLLGTPAFTEFPCLVRGSSLTRFRIEFNHIRQKARPGRQCGDSVDKDPGYGPSDLFRTHELDRAKYTLDLVEFMCIMPVSSEGHRYINQSSAYGDITLAHYDKKYWPWILQEDENFEEFIDWVGARSRIRFDREWLVDHLSSIDHSDVFHRVKKYRLADECSFFFQTSAA